jgi:cell division protein FtsB
MHTPPDDILSISPNPPHHSAAAITAHINASAQDLEEKISQHLHGSFSYWMSLPPQTRAEFWRLELARAISTKSTEIKKVNDELEKTRQENAHLKHQIEQLSRCQMPREFAMCPPATIPMSKKLAIELGELGIRGGCTGLNFGDKGEEVGVLVERAVGRWRGVVRGQRGLGGQKRLGAGEALLGPGSEQGSQILGQGMGQQEAQNQHLLQMKGTVNGNGNSNGHTPNAGHDDMDLDADGDVDGDLDADGDADIDADGEDYVLHEHTPSHSQAHTPSAIHHNPNINTSSNKNQNQQHSQGHHQHQQQQSQLQNQNRIPEAIMAAYSIQQQQQNHSNNNSNMGSGNINGVNSGPGMPNQQSHGLANGSMQQMVVNGRGDGRVMF